MFISLMDLWLPILLSGAGIWIVSAIVWMALPHHKSDWRSLPNEDAVMAAVRGVPPGHYMFPWAADMAAWKTPEFQARLKDGPTGHMTVQTYEERTGMGRMMLLSFVYYLGVSVVVAYVASRTLAPGTDYLMVFRMTSTVTFAALGFATVQDTIWFGKGWARTAKVLVDALLYGLVAGGIFGTFWPGS